MPAAYLERLEGNVVGSFDPKGCVTFEYRNWKGKVATRTVMPLNLSYDDNHRHSGGVQWFLHAYCCEKRSRRSFALEDILSPIRHVVPRTNEVRQVREEPPHV